MVGEIVGASSRPGIPHLDARGVENGAYRPQKGTRTTKARPGGSRNGLT
jgi:hypothetical protein